MMIQGIGVELIDINRVKMVITRHGRRFLDKIFTEDEIRFCQKSPKTYAEFAALYAAKSAVYKTIKPDIGVTYRDIEVICSDKFPPSLYLHGFAKRLAERMYIDDILVSFSFEGQMVVAMTVFDCK